MLANNESTAETMLLALSTSISRFAAAAELDIDRSEADRGFFAESVNALEAREEKLTVSDTALTRHQRREGLRLQARVVIGDIVLDRGVRQAKARTKLELKNSAMPEGADHLFPADVTELVDAELSKEPALVLGVLERFDQVPDFSGKDALHKDLTGRATRQEQCLSERTAGDRVESRLRGQMEMDIKDGADLLYRLEKRMLERFPRDTRYVRSFFYDVRPSRGKKGSGNGGDAGEGGGSSSGSATAT